MDTVRGPIAVVLTRDVEESTHLVDIAVAHESGRVEMFGNVETQVIPRSAIKPIQAIPLVRSGAAAAFDISPTEIALAGSSHSGESEHVTAVANWLAKIGVDESVLECGADRPISKAAADRLLTEGVPHAPIHNCCSGKHTGFLTTCRHLGYDTADYIGRPHPVQQLVTEAIAQFTEVDVHGQSSGIDGCGIGALARSMVNLVRPDRFDADTAAAAAQICDAYVKHPWWVSGSGRPEVELSAVATEPIVLKGGAEGVFVAALPTRGIGIALKVRDGAQRAAATAVAVMLEYLEVVAPATSRVELTNRAGTVVGEMSGRLP